MAAPRPSHATASPARAKLCATCNGRFEGDVLFCPQDGTPLAGPSALRTPSFAGEGDPYVGVLLEGQIRIEQLLGVGSMGRVYRAFQGGIDRHVAVKILHRELSANEELVSRFHREAKIASRLVHPNVVQVLMTGAVPEGPRIGGELYLVMEHLDGISLLSALSAAERDGEPGGALPLARALHVILQICDAVGEAHAAGIVHRDVKPENVMLVRRGEDHDFVKVLDFGIARMGPTGPQSTQAGLIFGTAKYISPEGAEGLPVGPPADVYGIATVLYQCLSGRTPFDGDSPVKLLLDHTSAEPPELLRVPRAAYVPAPIAAVVMRNLAKRAEARARDARELGREIVAAMRVSGLEPSARYASALEPGGALRLASRERTRSMDLKPDLAARLGAAASGASGPPPEPAEDPGARQARGVSPGPPEEPATRDERDETESTLEPVAAAPRARTTRVVALSALAAAFALGGFAAGLRQGAARATQGERGEIEAAREALRAGALDGPAGSGSAREQLEALTRRRPQDPALAELRREGAERAIARAVGARYGGRLGEAERLARLAVALDPGNETAARLRDELEAAASGLARGADRDAEPGPAEEGKAARPARAGVSAPPRAAPPPVGAPGATSAPAAKAPSPAPSSAPKGAPASTASASPSPSPSPSPEPAASAAPASSGAVLPPDAPPAVHNPTPPARAPGGGPWL